MSNQENLLQLRATIEALPAEQVKTPNVPADVFVQEAENLAAWAADDAAALATVGFTAERLAELPVRAGALREAQSLWMKESRSLDDWNAQSPAAYELRDELLHNFGFAFRKNDSLLARVAQIEDGTGHDDMLQDLNDLAVLGKENAALLSAISFDLTKLDTAATLSTQLAELLASVNGLRIAGNPAKYLRDQAFAYLKEQVDELRAAGKFLFWKNERRLKGYSSAYWRKVRTKKQTETEA